MKKMAFSNFFKINAPGRKEPFEKMVVLAMFPKEKGNNFFKGNKFPPKQLRLRRNGLSSFDNQFFPKMTKLPWGIISFKEQNFECLTKKKKNKRQIFSK
jgi:hypothetical protein